MSRDQTVGALLLVGSVIGIIIYGWLVFNPSDFVRQVVIEITAFVAVAAILGILAWIGYTLATTPPPKPIEEIEKEVEGELKKLEAEEKKETGEKKEEKKE